MTQTPVESRAAQDTDTSEPDGSTSPNNAKTLKLGLVASPGLCTEIASDIEGDLALRLAEDIDNSVEWTVDVLSDPLIGSDLKTDDLLEELQKLTKTHDWDYTIALTDLPVRDGHVIIVDASTEQQAGWISAPALGVIRMRSRVCSMVLQVVRDLRTGASTADGPDRLISLRLARRAEVKGSSAPVDIRYVAAGPLDQARLLVGMVYANEPWDTFGSFKTTIATAVATASYALIFTSVWEFGAVYTYARLITLTLVATGFLSTWIIISHQLWQPYRGRTDTYVASMYNATTVATVASGVVFAYALILIVLMIEAVAFMPPSILESRLQISVSPLTFVKAAWVAATVGTLAGAIGAGLEDTETVRRATFGWRQRRRYEEYQQQEKKEQEANEEGRGDQR